MDVKQALAELGADKQPDEQTRAALDRDGFATIPDVLSPDQLEQVRARLAELSEQEGPKAGLEVHQEAGTDRLADLVNKGEVFEVFYTEPRVLAAVAYVLDGDVRLSSLNSRASLPGQGQQGLHADWGGPVQPGQYQVCNSIWLLDDFTPRNGATRVVPGSHRSGQHPAQALADPMAPHPDEVQLLGTAGSVVVFNSHLWHGGTRNDTDKPRRAAHSYFTRRNQPQQLDQRKYLRHQTYLRLSPAARCILDVED